MNTEQLYTLFKSCSGVTTDSRNCPPQSLYIALKGERFDGNHFVQSALASGCKAAITDVAEIAEKHKNAHLVDDGLHALQELARHHRSQLHQTTLIGLTGSNGKTTTKELLRDVLKSTYPTFATRGNLNNHIGVPLSILEIDRTTHRYAIIEMGANAQGEITFLSEIAAPDYGLITNIGLAHLEGFGGPEGVKKGKRELFNYLKQQKRMVFVNAADPVLLEISEGIQRELYGTDVNSPEVFLISSAPTLTISWSHHSYFSPPVETNLVGDYNLGNIATAIAIGRYFEVKHDAINEAISAYRPDNNRSEQQQTERNTLILDAYNANPSSMAHALRSFAQSYAEPRLCILGDMFELGDAAPEEHRKIIDLTKSLHLKAYFVGELFCKETSTDPHCFASTDLLLDYLKEANIHDTNILIKGSRGMTLERCVALL